MNLQELLSSPLAERLGWTLLHSLWQMTAVAALTAFVLALFRRRSPQARYLTICAAMGLMVIGFAATFLAVHPSPPSPAATLKGPGVSLPDVVMAAPAFLQGPTIPVETASPLPATPAVGPPKPSATPVPAVTAPVAPWPERVCRWLAPYLPWLVGIWLVGMLALSLWRLGGWIAVVRLRVIGTRPIGQDIQAMLARLAARLGLRRAISIVQSAVVATPAVIGWLRPVVLLPVAAMTGLTPSQIEAILAHELAHIRRHDYMVNLLQTLVETLLFYHPAVWWASRRMRAEREHCCDDIAVALCGDHIGYAEALAAVVESRMPMPAVAAGSPDGRDLLDRVGRILGLSTQVSGRTTVVSAALSLALVVAVIAIPLAVTHRGAAQQSAPATHPSLTSASQPAAARWSWQVDGNSEAPLGTWQEELKRVQTLRYSPTGSKDPNEFLRNYQRVLDAKPPKDVALWCRLDMAAVLRMGFNLDKAHEKEAIQWVARMIVDYRDMPNYRSAIVARNYLAEMLDRHYGRAHGDLVKALYGSVVAMPDDQVVLRVPVEAHPIPTDLAEIETAQAEVDANGNAIASDRPFFQREIEQGNQRYREGLLVQRRAAIDNLRQGAAWHLREWANATNRWAQSDPFNDPAYERELDPLLKEVGKIVAALPPSPPAAAKPQASPPAWPEAVNGISIRIRPTMPLLAPDGWPRFLVDFRNGTGQKVGITSGPESGRVQVDGVWYRLPAGAQRETTQFNVEDGKDWPGVLLWLAIDGQWRDDEGKPLARVGPGEHTFRLAFAGLPKEVLGQQSEILSNVLHVVIPPLAETKPCVTATQPAIRIASPQAGQPSSKPSAVAPLKGAVGAGKQYGVPIEPIADESTLPPAKAVVINPDVFWQSSTWAGQVENTEAVGMDTGSGHPRFTVTAAAKRHVWIYFLANPVPPGYPIAVLTYKARNTASNGNSVIWMDDTTGPVGSGLNMFRNQDLKADGEVHSLRVDMRGFQPKGPITGLALGVATGKETPAEFDLLGLRFEAAPDAPAAEAVKDGDPVALRVVDAKGNPVQGATVTVDPERTNWARSAQTDPDGRVAITPLETSAGPHTVRIAKAGFVTVEAGGRAVAGIPQQVTLVPGRSYGGVVQDEQGNPVAGASVSLFLPRAVAKDGSQIRRSMDIITDAQGHWSTPLLPADLGFGSLVLRVIHPDYFSDGKYIVVPAPIIEGLRDGTAVQILKKGPEASGAAANPAGSPVPAAPSTGSGKALASSEPPSKSSGQGHPEPPIRRGYS